MQAVSLARHSNTRRAAAVAVIAASAICISSRPTIVAAALPAPADTLREPPALHNRSRVPGVVEFDLTAAPAKLQLAPGGPLADAYAYNGSVPGPTIDVREGDSVVIHFHNELPETSTVHWHGLHIPAAADGSALDPIPPGTTHDYTFRLARGSAGTYWYHPHPDVHSTRQVAMGLFGAFIVRAADDPLAARGIAERLLILSDNRFDSAGQVAFPDPRSIAAEVDLENGREGNVLFVNGQVAPEIPIARGQLQRWRIVNAAAARVYRLALPGRMLIKVGTDDGLFEHPVQVPEVVLANSGRVELLVRGEGSTALVDLPYDRYMPQTRPEDWDSTRTILSVRLSGAPVARAVAIPAVLRPVAALDTTQVATRRVIVMSQGQLDGKRMDMHRIDIRARLNTTEIWTIQNVVGMDHPFHLHGFHAQVLDRGGVPEPYPSWNDTVNVPKHSAVRILVHFDDYPGRWMYHCHILDHEDEGMMGVLELSN
jgi:FtsP/CotA-like multicopper oxidase with cupredoxin domain